MLCLLASSGEEAASSHGEENMGTGPRTQWLEPQAWANQQDAASPLPPVGALTFHSARTSRASSRRPPSVLPTMIQMGICESSCLEISNVICKGRKVARSTALPFWGLGGNLGQGQSSGDSWHLGQGCILLLRETLEGWVAPNTVDR